MTSKRDTSTGGKTELRFLDALGQGVSKHLDADAILAVTTQMLALHLGASVCAYADMDEDQDGFTIRGDWAAPGSESIVGHYTLAAFGKLAVGKLGAGEPLVINDALEELPPDEATTFQSIGVSATICMPLIKQGRLTALMAVHNKIARVWTEDEIAVVREVTERSWAHVERARAEAQMRDSEERYRTLFDAIDEGFCIIEFIDSPHGPLSDYIHVEANAAYAKHAGIENVVGQKVREMVGAEADEWVRLYRGVLETGTPIRFERELEATGRWLELSAYRVEPQSRSQVAVLFQDQTDRKLAELALRESEEEFRTLARAMPNQAWTALPNGMLDWFNEQVYVYSGMAQGALDGAGWAVMVHDDDIAQSERLWSTALKTGETYENQFRLRRADGAYRWHLTRAVAIKDDSGRVTRWIGTNTDIHDQKEAAANLEQRVEERTRQLMQAEEALRQSQKMEAVGQLTGGLAHDFNNLLAGISGSLELIAKRLAEGRTTGLERYLTGAQESTRRAASLTQRLLAFSRRQTLDPRAININRLVAGIEDLVRRSVGPDVQVEVVQAGGLWTAKVDESQLENALLNLCINARDAMAPAGGRITIETANKWLDDRAARDRDLPPGQYVSLCVTDTGTGMSQDVINRAFDPFFTTKPLGQGTGLGLSMVYGFARQSGGQVRIYSEVGAGTTMCLYFPRYIGEADESVSTVSTETLEQGHGEVVLVVDDEVVLRMLMFDVLQDNGYRALESVDGPSAMKIIESDQRIDLLITDVGLPNGMNGRQLADAARRTRPDLKVLFITGYAENAVVGNGHLAPGMEVLTKPFEIAAFGHKVRDMIDRG
jgi:PAS domain S-box-containing protein